MIYTASDHNIKYAVRRMIGKRFPGDPGRDELMNERQRIFIDQHSDALQSYFDSNRPSSDEFTSTLRSAREHHADTHPKKMLRINAYSDWCASGEILGRVWLRRDRRDVKLVLYKAKKDEVAKPNKYQRAIGDLGVSASLEGAWLTKAMKNRTDGVPLLYKGGHLTFIQKPTGHVLDQVFEDLVNPQGRYAFYLHSDDSCLSIRINGVVYRFNVDISSCDASHSMHIFALLESLAGRHSDAMKRLVDQCRLAFMVRSRSGKGKIVFKTRDNRPRLYSGSTITTLINNLANYLIGMAIADMQFPTRELTPQEVGALVEEAISTTGYVCTLVYCEITEDLQFLKNSPILSTDGSYRSMLNLGVLLRASGTCKGDLPGRGALRERGKAFQAGLLQGFYPKSACTVVDNMKLVAGPLNPKFEATIRDVLSYKHIRQDAVSFSDESVYRRYRLSPSEIASIEEFSSSDYGMFTANAGLSKILDVDYGLHCLNRIPESAMDFRNSR